jgi:hypothetical protein
MLNGPETPDATRKTGTAQTLAAQPTVTSAPPTETPTLVPEALVQVTMTPSPISRQRLVP